MTKTHAEIARQKNPKLARLQNLKAYHRLNPRARLLVKAVVIDGEQPNEQNGGLNWVRCWNSKPVVDCLSAFGWSPPEDPARLAALVEDLAVPVPAGPVIPYQPNYPPPAPDLPCAECGVMGRHAIYGDRRLCSKHFLAVLGIRGGLTAAAAATTPEPAPIPEERQPIIAGTGQSLTNQLFPRMADIGFWQQQLQDEQDERRHLIQVIEDQRRAKSF